MDEMLIEIMEVLKEAKELIDKRNDALTWRGNRVLNVTIRDDKIDVLMSNTLPIPNAPMTKTELRKSAIDEHAFCREETQEINGVMFSNIEYEEAGDNAKMAV